MADVDALIDEVLAENESQQGSDVANSNVPPLTNTTVSSADSSAEIKKAEIEKSNHLVYRRVKKGEKESIKENAVEDSEDPLGDAIEKACIDGFKPIRRANPPNTPNLERNDDTTEEEEHKPTAEELRAMLKQKARNKRQDLIQQRTSKKEKEKKGALTPIYYCDADQCRNITKDNGKYCPKCRCFYYCSAECQTADWVKHKEMCGKNPTEDGVAKFNVYIQARDAAQELYMKVRKGDYITVMNEKESLGMPACMFASVATKSNVIFWKTYLKNPIFTTAKPDTIGTMAYKLEAAMAAFPDKKVYLISVLLDRIRDQQTAECVLRFFIANEYGGTMESPADGKIKKQVVRYSRKAK